MEKKRLYFVIGACAAFVIGILLLALLASLQQQARQQQPAQQLNDYTGNFACLPQNSPQLDVPETLECAQGLKTTDGKYYALKDIPEDYKYLEFSANINVVGELTPASSNEKYATSGTIKVKTIEVLLSND